MTTVWVLFLTVRPVVIRVCVVRFVWVCVVLLVS